MSLTDKTELDRIIQWASQRDEDNKGLEDKWQEEIDSYYVDFPVGKCIYEYDVSTVPQIESTLRDMWKEEPYMQKVAKPCAVGAYKNKPDKGAMDAINDGSGRAFKVSEYVYMF